MGTNRFSNVYCYNAAMSYAPLETPRLILRAWRDADVDAWAALNADARVMEFFPSTYDRARSERSAASLSADFERNGYGWWAVEVKNGQAFAGVVALQKLPDDMPFAPATEVGWRFAFDAWGCGYATEAATAALAFAFNRLQREEVVAFTAAVNLRSRRVMEKLGMRRDAAGDFEHPNLPPGHSLRDHVLYRVRREPSGRSRG